MGVNLRDSEETFAKAGASRRRIRRSTRAVKFRIDAASLAAIQCVDPVEVEAATLTALSWVNENSPRWLPVPVPLVANCIMGKLNAPSWSFPCSAPLEGY
jgi:hypothetical protein